MKLIYVPLDERPCNAKFVKMIASIQNSISIIQPCDHILSKKKDSANVEKCWEFVLENALKGDYAILSMDMLLYGGLLPSRIHYLDKDVIQSRLEYIRLLKKKNPKLIIYAFQCIMRCPHYSSSEEEPDYYEEYGESLFTRAWLMNKEERIGLSDDERSKLTSINIPSNIVNDYEIRRNFNLEFNLKVTDLVKEGIIDTLVIPQDDSSEYGYTAIAQKKIVDKISSEKLSDSVFIYPGADEVGCSLLARAWNHFNDRELYIYPIYSSTLGNMIVPLYEDRPIAESLKKHIDIINGSLVENANECDFILAVNTCGKVMQESFNQLVKRDITYSSYRDIKIFVKQIKRFLSLNKPVAVCDSAYSNGSDLGLIEELDIKEVYEHLCGYAGWNTNCNSLGTVLSMASLGFDTPNENLRQNLIYRLLEDAYYQALVRQEVIRDFLPANNLSYYTFEDKQNLVEEEIKNKIQNHYNRTLMSKKYPTHIKNVSTPWKRMFEIDLDI